MLVKDLPAHLQARAIEYQKAQGNSPDLECNVRNDAAAGNFNWDETIEGFGFWNTVVEDWTKSTIILSTVTLKELVRYTNWYRTTSFNVEGNCDEDCVAMYEKEIYGS